MTDSDDELKDRIPYGEEEQVEDNGLILYVPRRSYRCPDCKAFKGNTHNKGCDVEQCPVCGLQLLHCGHWHVVFGQ